MGFRLPAALPPVPYPPRSLNRFAVVCHMKFNLVLILIAVSLVPASAARADLAGDVKAILRDRYFNKVDVGIAIARLPAGPSSQPSAATAPADVLFRYESDIPLKP